MQEALTKFYTALDMQCRKGDPEQVERFLLQREASLRSGGSEQEGERIAVYNELGLFYRSTGQYEQSVSVFHAAAQHIAAQMGEDSSQYAAVLNNLAGTYRLMGSFQEAIGLFEKAICIYQRNEEKTYAYASVLNNMAMVYREAKQPEEAVAYLEEALTILETMPERREETAVTYNNLTALYHAAGDMRRAHRCAQLAITWFARCADTENVHYAAGMNSLAGFLYADGKYEQALELYRKSAEYTERFFGDSVDYAVTCQNMYWVYEKLGRRAEAIAVLERAEDIFRRQLGAGHERTRIVADDLKRLKETDCA